MKRFFKRSKPSHCWVWHHTHLEYYHTLNKTKQNKKKPHSIVSEINILLITQQKRDPFILPKVMYCY